MYVCITQDAEFPLIIRAKDAENKTTSDLLKFLGTKKLFLAYENDKYWERLSDDCIPLNQYPAIARKEKLPFNINSLPHLSLYDSSLSKKCGRKIRIQSQTQIEFPLMTVNLDQQQYQTISVLDLRLIIEKLVEYKISDPQLFQNDVELDINEKAELFLENAKETPLVFKCQISDASLSNISERQNSSKEIYFTEERYIALLNKLENYYKPAFQKLSAFNPKEIDQLFSSIPELLESHQRFFRDIPSEINFASCFGYIILRHLTRLTKAGKLFSPWYEENHEMITDKLESEQSFQRALAKLDEESLGFESVYASPIQRYPRYKLLVEKLERHTPSWHPDKKVLKQLLSQLVVMNNEIDKEILIQKTQKIFREWPSEKQILAQTRTLKDEVRVKMIKPKVAFGSIYLFPDIIVIATENKKKMVPCLSIDVFDFTFYNCRPKANSILIVTKTNRYELEFRKFYKNIFLEKLYEAKRAIFPDPACNKPQFFFLDVNHQGAPELCSFSGAFTTDSHKIFFFGGLSKPTLPTNFLIQFDPATQSFTKENTPVLSRSGHTVTAIGDCIYVAFGFNRNTIYNDIWQYDSDTGFWKDISLGKNLPERKNHSCAAYGDELFFFGGENRSNKLINVVSKFNVQTCEYEQLSNEEDYKAPPGTHFHTAEIVNKYLVIFGGKNKKGMSEDVYAFDLVERAWHSFHPNDVLPRFNHRMHVIMDRFLLILYGISKNGAQPPILLDLCSGYQISIKLSGNIPPSLLQFASVSFDDKILLYGGMEAGNNRSLMSAFTIELKTAMAELGKNKYNYAKGNFAFCKSSEVSKFSTPNPNWQEKRFQKMSPRLISTINPKKLSQQMPKQAFPEEQGIDDFSDDVRISSSGLNGSAEKKLQANEEVHIQQNAIIKQNKMKSPSIEKVDNQPHHQKDSHKSHHHKPVSNLLKKIHIKPLIGQKRHRHEVLPDEDSLPPHKRKHSHSIKEGRLVLQKHHSKSFGPSTRRHSTKNPNFQKDLSFSPSFIQKDLSISSSNSSLSFKYYQHSDSNSSSNSDIDSIVNSISNFNLNKSQEEINNSDSSSSFQDKTKMLSKSERDKLPQLIQADTKPIAIITGKPLDDDKNGDRFMISGDKGTDGSNAQPKFKIILRVTGSNPRDDDDRSDNGSNSMIELEPTSDVINSSTPSLPEPTSDVIEASTPPLPEPTSDVIEASSPPLPEPTSDAIYQKHSSEGSSVESIGIEKPLVNSLDTYIENYLNKDLYNCVDKEAFSEDKNDPKIILNIMKLNNYKKSLTTNHDLERKITQFELILSNDRSKMPPFNALLKIFDSSTNEIKIAKVSSECTPDDISKKVSSVLGREAFLSIQVESGVFEELNENVLQNAYWSLYNENTRAIYINCL